MSSPSPKSSILRPNPNAKPKAVKIKSPIGTGSDTKIPWATFNQEGVIQPIFGQGGQRDQGHREVLHDQGEDYQQPITFRSGSIQVPRSFEEVSSKS